jgi:hypothetical protein
VAIIAAAMRGGPGSRHDGGMKWLFLLLSPVVLGQDAKEIIRQSVQRDLLNFERLKNYTYHEHDEVKSFDKHDKLKKTEKETYEILILGGHDYEKLIERDDKPLPPKDAVKEQEKMDKEIERRKNESAADKARIEKERQEQRKFLDEVPEEFDFKLLGVEQISGKLAWVISADPKPGYQPKSRGAKLIANMRGKVWIDQGEYQWVKVEAQAVGKLSYGFGMLKINPGATVQFEQTRVNDEVWLPAHASIRVDGRAALLVPIHDQIDMQFRDYRKFQAESQLVVGGEVQ